jgi:hypothetical protein
MVSGRRRADCDRSTAGQRVVVVHARTGRQWPRVHRGRRCRIGLEQQLGRQLVVWILGLVGILRRRRRLELELRRRSHRRAALVKADRLFITKNEEHEGSFLEEGIFVIFVVFVAS